jgi:hypothetical protein
MIWRFGALSGNIKEKFERVTGCGTQPNFMLPFWLHDSGTSRRATLSIFISLSSASGQKKLDTNS